MNFLRKAAAYFANSFFLSFLFLALVTFSLNAVITKPSSLKSWLRDSGIYSTLVPNVLSQAKDNPSDTGSTLPLNDPNVKAAAEKAFTPAYLQTSTENFIDGMYHWLDGKTATPDFKIDLSTPKNAFASNIGSYLTTRVAGLGACSPSQVPSEFDPFTVNCIPKGVDAKAEINQVTNDLENSQDFLDKPELTNATLTTEKNGQKRTIADSYKSAPKVYQKLKIIPITSSLLALIFAVGVIFLSPSVRRGVRRITITLITTSAFLAFFALLIHTASDTLNSKISKSSSSTADFQKSGIYIVNKIGGTLIRAELTYAGVLLALGIAGIVYLHLTKTKPETPEESPETPKPKPAAAV